MNYNQSDAIFILYVVASKGYYDNQLIKKLFTNVYIIRDVIDLYYKDLYLSFKKKSRW